MTQTDKWARAQEDFFDSLSVNFGPYDFENESRASKKTAEKFLRFLDLTTGQSILEMGCGRGEWCLRLAKLGYTVTGIDLSQKSLDILAAEAERLGVRSQLNLIKGDIQSEPSSLVTGEKFDCVFGYNLLHHVSDIRKTVTNMTVLTRSGGRVVTYEPNPLHWWWLVCPLFDRKFRWSIEKGLLRTSPFKIKIVFNECGLKDVVTMAGDYFPFLSPDRTHYITEKIGDVLAKTPFLSNLSAVYYTRGYKR